MEDTIVRKIYLRCVLAAAATCAVSILAHMWVHVPVLQVLGFAALMFAYLFAQIFLLQQALKKGNCVVIYGTCVSKEESYDVFGKKKKNMLSYRFIAASQKASEADTSDEEPLTSFMLEGTKGKFVEGESYRFLFKTAHGNSVEEGDKSKVFNENNLLGYEIFGAMPASVPVTQEESQYDTVDDQEEVLQPNDESINEELPSKLIVFHKQEEAGQ